MEDFGVLGNGGSASRATRILSPHIQKSSRIESRKDRAAPGKLSKHLRSPLAPSLLPLPQPWALSNPHCSRCGATLRTYKLAYEVVLACILQKLREGVDFTYMRGRRGML